MNDDITNPLHNKVIMKLLKASFLLLCFSSGKAFSTSNPLSSAIQTFSFPDGSMYRGETKDGRINGMGEWRGSTGERYVGSFSNDLFHGPGRHIDAEGNMLQGNFEMGSLEGAGIYYHADGRVELGTYINGKDTGEGCRLSPCRLQAWKLQNGEVLGDVSTGEISLLEAVEIASKLGLDIPESPYALGVEHQARLAQNCVQQLPFFTGNVDYQTPEEDGPSKSGSLIAHSTIPLVDVEVCDNIVAECEAYTKNIGGWTTRRHENYPTTDIPIFKLPGTIKWFKEKLLPDIAFPFVAKAFEYSFPENLLRVGTNGEKMSASVGLGIGLRVVDAFVVKYNATAGQRELKQHRDGSVFSFNVALNDLSEYSGGGTSFRILQRHESNALNDKSSYIRSKKGHILAHSSALVHGGHPINAGVRYLLVVFVSVDPLYRPWASSFYERVKGMDPADIEKVE